MPGRVWPTIVLPHWYCPRLQVQVILTSDGLEVSTVYRKQPNARIYRAEICPIIAP